MVSATRLRLGAVGGSTVLVAACTGLLGLEEPTIRARTDAGGEAAATEASTGADPRGTDLVDAAEAGHAGSWCLQNGAGKTDCWDFDVDGGLLNGWRKQKLDPGGGFDAAPGHGPDSLPNAFSASLKFSGSAEASSDLSQEFPGLARLAVLAFDMKIERCTLQDAIALAAIKVGDDSSLWSVEVIGPPYTGLRAVSQTGGNVSPAGGTCTTSSDGTSCLSNEQLPFGTWMRIRLEAERVPPSTTVLRLFSEPRKLVEWQVSFQPGSPTWVTIGERADLSADCVTSYDNVTFNETF
jgi:hypothetical protein